MSSYPDPITTPEYRPRKKKGVIIGIAAVLVLVVIVALVLVFTSSSPDLDPSPSFKQHLFFQMTLTDSASTVFFINLESSIIVQFSDTTALYKSPDKVYDVSVSSICKPSDSSDFLLSPNKLIVDPDVSPKIESKTYQDSSCDLYQVNDNFVCLLDGFIVYYCEGDKDNCMAFVNHTLIDSSDSDLFSYDWYCDSQFSLVFSSDVSYNESSLFLTFDVENQLISSTSGEDSFVYHEGYSHFFSSSESCVTRTIHELPFPKIVDSLSFEPSQLIDKESTVDIDDVTCALYSINDIEYCIKSGFIHRICFSSTDECVFFSDHSTSASPIDLPSSCYTEPFPTVHQVFSAGQETRVVGEEVSTRSDVAVDLIEKAYSFVTDGTFNFVTSGIAYWGSNDDCLSDHYDDDDLDWLISIPEVFDILGVEVVDGKECVKISHSETESVETWISNDGFIVKRCVPDLCLTYSDYDVINPEDPRLFYPEECIPPAVNQTMIFSATWHLEDDVTTTTWINLEKMFFITMKVPKLFT
ncbi:hypothetical protein GEMRC1_008248 [Eukaryota sp. GEM-RC1]